MPNILNARGETVSEYSEERAVWYSAHCGYWTDDWSKLSKVGPGIPCCPVCGCPGMQTVAADWYGEGMRVMEEREPGYKAWLEAHKEHCFRPGTLLAAWRSYQEGRDASDVRIVPPPAD